MLPLACQITHQLFVLMPSNPNKILFEALTFDDVLLQPAYSEVLPKTTSTRTRLTKEIALHIPLLSAAMDTVTESELAIAMALEGGIGFIHKNMDMQNQAAQVKKVKRSQSGMILDPITLTPDASVREAKVIMNNNKIGGIPIVDRHNTLLGIVTNRDIRFQKNPEAYLGDIMTKEGLVTAKEGSDQQEVEKTLEKHKIEKLPIVNEQGKLTGLMTFKDILKKKDKPNACKDPLGRLRVGAAVGVSSDLIERTALLVEAGVDVVALDTAHGHSKGVIEACKLVKTTFPNLPLVAGNIATQEAALALKDAGVDAVKVGVGPGSICTTRIIAGVGIPQLSAVQQVAQALQGTGITIIADGGIRYSGDIAKAIAAGADCVMVGSLLAGTEEAPGSVIIFEGRKFKSYRGMGSVEAMENGSKDRYFQDMDTATNKLVPEGIVGRVPFKGMVSEVLFQLIGGLKAGMGYCGTPDIQSLQSAKFVKITASGNKESHPHDITITREAPNYSR